MNMKDLKQYRHICLFFPGWAFLVAFWHLFFFSDVLPFHQLPKRGRRRSAFYCPLAKTTRVPPGVATVATKKLTLYSGNKDWFSIWILKFLSLEGGSSIVGYDPMASVNVIDRSNSRCLSILSTKIWPKSKNTTLRQWPSCVLGSVGGCLCPVRPANFFWLSGCLLVGWVFCASRTSAEPVQLEQTGLIRLIVQQVSEQVAKEEMFEEVWFDLIHGMLWDVHGEPIVICEKSGDAKFQLEKDWL